MEKEKVEKLQKTEQETLLKEIEEQEMNGEVGGAWWNISKNLGNQGRFCTITKECQGNCN